MKTEDLMQRIATVLPSLPGWCDIDKAHALAAAVLTLRPAVVVEIGVFGGKSLIPMALACQAVGRGTVCAIDPWTQEAAAEGYDGANKEWWGTRNLEEIYQGFIAKLAELQLTDWVYVVRARSDHPQAWRLITTEPATIDLLHVDGQHTIQALLDVERFAPAVRVGGLVCMDDIQWDGGGVQHAVDWLLGHGFIELYKLGTGAMFQRVAEAVEL